MKNILLPKKESSCLHIIDPQEKLMAHIHENTTVLQTIEMMVDCAKILQLPMVCNTQYKKGLGDYPTSLSQRLAETKKIDKFEFNCLASKDPSMYYDDFLQNVETVILVGVETHICIYQTACGLLQRNIQPWIVTDAVSSRSPENHKRGLKRLEAIGCAVGPAEMIIYSLLERAGTSEFKEVLPFITKTIKS